MKFSTRATYGLKAMLYLADRYGESAVSVSQIAGDEKISAAYLEQILGRIKRKGWVKSVRGPRGGYVLTAKPSEIRVGTLLTALGEDALVRPASAPAGSAGSVRKARPAAPATGKTQPASDTVSAAADLFWRRLSDAFAEALDRVSLEDLIRSGRNKSLAEPIHFSI